MRLWLWTKTITVLHSDYLYYNCYKALGIVTCLCKKCIKWWIAVTLIRELKRLTLAKTEGLVIRALWDNYETIEYAK